MKKSRVALSSVLDGRAHRGKNKALGAPAALPVAMIRDPAIPLLADPCPRLAADSVVENRLALFTIG
jgi:hypothetical protein